MYGDLEFGNVALESAANMGQETENGCCSQHNASLSGSYLYLFLDPLRKEKAQMRKIASYVTVT